MKCPEAFGEPAHPPSPGLTVDWFLMNCIIRYCDPVKRAALELSRSLAEDPILIETYIIYFASVVTPADTQNYNT